MDHAVAMNHGPRILLLQLLNLLMGGGCYLMAVSSFGVWSKAEWSPVATGMVMLVANLAYGVLVGVGGRLADGWGRARTGVAGTLITLGGAGWAWYGGGDPWAGAVGTVLCFAGSALFFPGNAGLFSDARGGGGASVPLHVKVSRYNLGWSAGNLAGFLIAWQLSSGAVQRGYLVAGAGFVVILALLLPWWSLPARPPVADADRADHPALPRLIRLGRVALLLYCMVGMALIAQLENALSRLVPSAEAHTTATAALATYAFGYCASFAVLGAWGGWVLRPWRMFAISLLMPVAGLGFLGCGLAGITAILPLAFCGLVLGMAFAAIYTTSIYYSLRLPHGAARAASMHETFLGAGSTVGPLICGAFLMGIRSDLAGLGLYLLIGSALVAGWQLWQLPAIVRTIRGAS